MKVSNTFLVKLQKEDSIVDERSLYTVSFTCFQLQILQKNWLVLNSLGVEMLEGKCNYPVDLVPLEVSSQITPSNFRVVCFFVNKMKSSLWYFFLQVVL